MNTPKWVSELFHAVDAWDVERFMSFLAEDVYFRFGNSDAIQGKENVREEVKGWVSDKYSMQHTLDTTIVHGDLVVVHGIATYKMLDSSTLSLPFADIWTMEGPRINEYLVFIDITQLESRLAR